jgi:hypothetical protein
MGVLLFIVVGLAIWGAIVYVAYRQQQKRLATLANIAASVGFAFTRGDPDRLVDMPFDLFNKGSKRRVDCEMGGVHSGVNMRIFDYKYYVSNGKNGQWYKVTCGLAMIPAACPVLHIAHQGFFGSLENLLGAHDIQFESDDFNKCFRVKCTDQKFAFSLIDGSMMEWLLGAQAFNNIEIVGSWVLYTGPRLQPNDWLGIGTWLDQFHAHIPNVVYSQYPDSQSGGQVTS